MAETRYMISDVAKLVEVENHVLRYWEEELELEISRNEMGHRYYTEDDVKKFQKIKELKDQGYQLKIIKMLLSDDVMVSGGKVEIEIAKVDDNEVVTKVESEHEDKLLQFKRLLNGMILEALNENNQVIEKEVSESIIKEVDYLLRVKEEADEDRYRQLDELIRSRQRKRRLFGKEKEKSQGLFKSRDLKTEYI